MRWSGRQGVGSRHLIFVSGDDDEAAAGEDIQAEVKASFGPHVGLFGQHLADESDDRIAGEEDADGVPAAADVLVQTFVGAVRPDLNPRILRERGEREETGAGGTGARPRRAGAGRSARPAQHAHRKSPGVRRRDHGRRGRRRSSYTPL